MRKIIKSNSFLRQFKKAKKEKMVLGYDHQNEWFYVSDEIHRHPLHETIKDFRK